MRASRRASNCRARTASISGACCRRRCTTPPPALRCIAQHGVAPDFIIPERQPGQFRGLRLGAQAGTAHRTHRAGAQRQPHRAGFPARPATGSRAPACRPWPRPWMWARLATWSACAPCFRTSKSVRGAVQRGQRLRRRDPGAHQPRISGEYGKVWCPHTATAAEVYARMSRGGARKCALDHGLDRASGEISRNRGAAHRAANRNAGKPC